ncbi:DUF4326 domain-containing protein [Roseibium sp. Sym1]|uniref:DUF4326 domain-containing protein n=1 Tax=Roseibium sp. Sym1 TaxID=3016006 RepID=UPI0022B3B648|nr:DUF4326 domain-containing protein [Roseibium sp. Sym1]
MKPVRIQRKRTKGWNAHEAAGNGLPIAYVHRPLKWGNPFVFPRGNKVAQERAVHCFETALRGGRLSFNCEEVRRELKGRNLGCFCRLEDPCHADVLLAIANEVD